MENEILNFLKSLEPTQPTLKINLKNGFYYIIKSFKLGLRFVEIVDFKNQKILVQIEDIVEVLEMKK